MANDDPANSAEKGKGKAKDTDGNTSGNQANQTTATLTSTTATATAPEGSSVFSRIAQSAAGLSRDFVSARPSGGDLAALTSTDKAGPVSSGQSSQQSTAAGEGSAAALPAWASPFTGSSHAQQHATAQDAAFAEFLDGADIDMSLPTEPIIGLNDSMGDNNSGMESTWAAHQTSSTYMQTATITQQPSSAVAEQESRDGLDVVNLLAADGPPEEEPDYGDIELAEDEIKALKRALFGNNNENTGSLPATHQNWDNVLNFIPDFVRPNPLGGYEDEEVSAGAPVKSHDTQATMGMTHSSESTRQWLDQWHDVLTRYDDEVWGGLSPLVALAREEVDQLQQSEPEQIPAGTKALDRLRQILGHLRE
ncbi:hypothetical protein SBRCBS47491_005758 [Sporothrix bragantina]|uniref:Uncharacterized protein n=1 Tax=Sporothrix bragantina TaxID=671064 RepID=A0ABP0C074_9PEZI